MASTGRSRRDNSLETILTFDNLDAQSQWSMVWSTTQTPETQRATARSISMRIRGRRRLRIDSLALSAMMTMHCRVTASALTGGFFVFMLFLVAAVGSLANPLRHFEVYLGQWSMSGPGRAFRIIPMLDGIGIAMCINAIMRAINCCTIAAIAALYVTYSVSDEKLPFTYCRDFNLQPYDPEWTDLKTLSSLGSRYSQRRRIEDESSTVGFNYIEWSNASFFRTKKNHLSEVETCKETYPGSYPPIYNSPAYNFFYVEVIQHQSEYTLGQFNKPLLVALIIAWLVIWLTIFIEKVTHNRLIWNNIRPWFIIVPWLWTLLLAVCGASKLTLQNFIRKAFRIGSKEVMAIMVEAFEVALYIHSASVGTELIHGKALNHYASGHIDPYLNNENVWHSTIVLMLAGIHSAGAAMCGLIDFKQFNATGSYDVAESTLWIIPMYSKCTYVGNYSHLITTLIFGGMMFSYITVAFVLVKTALHTIFEYKVKLVLSEQIVVATLICFCMGISLIFATKGGIVLLESINTIMTGVAMPFIILLEVVSLMYVYRSPDFQSDMHLATEENTCSTRIGLQWQIIPFIIGIVLILKIICLPNAEMPAKSMCLAVAPLVAIMLALPLRAFYNAYVYLRPSTT